MPLTFPVLWSWSTTKGSTDPQITHSCVVAFISASFSSEITARNFPRLLAFRYADRHALHQLSKPLRFLLCNGKNSAVAGLSSLQRVQANSSMLATPYLFWSLDPWLSSPMCSSSCDLPYGRRKSLGVCRPLVEVASSSCPAFWQRLAPWRSGRRWDSCLPCVAMLVS